MTSQCHNGSRLVAFSDLGAQEQHKRGLYLLTVVRSAYGCHTRKERPGTLLPPGKPRQIVRPRLGTGFASTCRKSWASGDC